MTASNLVTADEYMGQVAAAMSEAVLQERVQRAALAAGWRYYHAPANRPGGKRGAVQRIVPGFPDLVLAHPAHGILYAELKRQGEYPTKAQREWLALLDTAAGRTVAYVWRPLDLLNGTIDRILNPAT